MGASLAVPALADRVRRERCNDLASRDGKLMTLFVSAKILGPYSDPEDARLVPARKTAEQLLQELKAGTACRCGGWAEIRSASGTSTGRHPPGWSSERGRWSGVSRRTGDGPRRQCDQKPFISHISHKRERMGARECL
ncbi:hypothetical protein HOK021_41560 [Streptomyces hygroscopicus]|nr:hypothetical protein HOK021_41560 [Streptomyces hygroscopicus]